MRYIVNDNGYLLQVSFGAMIECDGRSCTEYTGDVPAGYSSLADWSVKEADKLHRWYIKNGDLTLDPDAPEPPAIEVTSPPLIPLTQAEYDALVDAEQVDDTSLYLIVRDV